MQITIDTDADVTAYTSELGKMAAERRALDRFEAAARALRAIEGPILDGQAEPDAAYEAANEERDAAWDACRRLGMAGF